MQPSREPRVSFRWRRVRSPAPAIMPVRILSRCAPRVKPSSPRKAMPKHSETRHLPYSPEQMFDLVSDVKRYPEFLPWVTAVRVRIGRASCGERVWQYVEIPVGAGIL